MSQLEAHVLATALAWAKADRVADDRCADLGCAERTFVKAAASNLTKQQRALLSADRDGAVIAFRQACVVEHNAAEAMMEAARKLLDSR